MIRKPDLRDETPQHLGACSVNTTPEQHVLCGTHCDTRKPSRGSELLDDEAGNHGSDRYGIKAGMTDELGGYREDVKRLRVCSTDSSPISVTQRLMDSPRSTKSTCYSVRTGVYRMRDATHTSAMLYLFPVRSSWVTRPWSFALPVRQLSLLEYDWRSTPSPMFALSRNEHRYITTTTGIRRRSTLRHSFFCCFPVSKGGCASQSGFSVLRRSSAPIAPSMLSLLLLLGRTGSSEAIVVGGMICVV